MPAASKKPQLNARVSPSAYALAHHLAARYECSQADLLERLLADHAAAIGVDPASIPLTVPATYQRRVAKAAARQRRMTLREVTREGGRKG